MSSAGLRRAVKRGVLVIPLMLLASAVAVPVSAGPTSDEAGSEVAQDQLSSTALKDLAAAYRATAPFHRIEAAQAAGWQSDVTGCLEFPDGYEEFGPGAMGHHYLNFDHYLDGGQLDPAKPEALLYETQADGSLRLTAVEYIVPEADLPRTAPPPVMFGREMMFHQEFSAWALHVWLWLPNPYGLFADVNPLVGCEHADGGGGHDAH